MKMNILLNITSSVYKKGNFDEKTILILDNL